jgi:hypothetical protein
MQTKASAPKVYTYYFSKDAGHHQNHQSEFESRLPVQSCFGGLDADFTSDSELPAYDSFHRMYTVNHILMMSEK